MLAMEGENAAKRVKTSIINDDASHSYYEETCKKIIIRYSGVNGDFHPLYIHQFYDEETVREKFKMVQTIELLVDCETLQVYIQNGIDLSGDVMTREQISAVLSPFMNKFPSDAIHFTKEKFEEAIQKDQIDIKLLPTNQEKGTKLRVWSSVLSNKIIKKLNDRVQPFLLMFIDGASVIDNKDCKWKINFLFDNETRQIVGFCSAYPFLTFPEGIRLRISQFFILPPFQRTGLGSALYCKVMEQTINDEMIKEITVEDPNDAFSNLRLSNDLLLMRKHGETFLQKLTILQKAKVQLFDKYQELFDCQEPKEELVKAWRVEVKKHLCKKFSDLIPTNDKEKRKQVLEELFQEELKNFCQITTSNNKTMQKYETITFNLEEEKEEKEKKEKKEKKEEN